MRHIRTNGTDLQIVERRNGGLAIHQGKGLLLLTRVEAKELAIVLLDELQAE